MVHDGEHLFFAGAGRVLEFGSHLGGGVRGFFELHRQHGCGLARAAQDGLSGYALAHQHGHEIFKICRRTRQFVAQLGSQTVDFFIFGGDAAV